MSERKCLARSNSVISVIHLILEIFIEYLNVRMPSPILRKQREGWGTLAPVISSTSNVFFKIWIQAVQV